MPSRLHSTPPPEEFVGQGGFLGVPEPFSPSVFLDLPPTPPRRDGGHDVASSDDLVLPFISRMLMEDDIDDKFFYQYPEHPVLLAALQPYAQILSASSSSSTSAITRTTLSTSGSSASAEPTCPTELAQPLHSSPYPYDFTADEASAVLLPAQDGATPRFKQTSMSGALPSDGGGERRQPASIADQRGGEAIQSSASRDGAEPAAGEDHDALTSAFFGDHQAGVNLHILNRAFAKGVEDAKKFLPDNNGLLVNTGIKPRSSMSMLRESCNGSGRKNRHQEEGLDAEIGRSSKVMLPEREDRGAQKIYDEIMSGDIEEYTERIKQLRIAVDQESAEKSSSRKGRRGRQGANVVVDLRAMLLRCAQAIAAGDLRGANEMLKHIKHHSSPVGDGTQRLAHCFAEALEARLAGTESLLYQSLISKPTSLVHFLRAYRLFMHASSLKKVKYIFSNCAIMNALAGKKRLHIVNYGVQHGFQWPGLLRYFGKMEGGPPVVRFTGIDLPRPGFRPALQIEKTGERLSSCADQFGVPFKFHAIAAKWETVTLEDLHIDPDEVLVVNFECFLDRLMDESVLVDRPSPRDMVLKNIRNMRPNVFIHCVLHGSFGVPVFLTRFREALFFYSAHFDMLDATIPRDNDVRMLIERDILGRSALNVIACEGADRLERPETYKQWQMRNNRAGLRQLPLRAETMKIVRDKVKGHCHKDILIDEDHQWLLQGWRGRVLYAMSTWVAKDSNSNI